jgi:hypothetical protein
MKRLFVLTALTLLLSGAVGIGVMYAVQLGVEPLAESFFAAAHLPTKLPALPPSTVATWSRYAGVGGFLMTMLECIRPSSTPAHRSR